MHPFFAAPRPLVFAHRGGSALAPENTIEAFDNGLRLGADGLELDVRLSRDGVVVVHHDRTLERTTGLTGTVASRTSAELHRAGVPALSAVLARYPQARVIIELKVNRVELAAAAVEAAEQIGALDRVCFGSFGFRVLRAVRRLAPAAATRASREEGRRALYRSWCGWAESRAGRPGYQIPDAPGPTPLVSPRGMQRPHRPRLV